MALDRRGLLGRDLRLVPDADPPQDHDRQKRDRRKPGDAGLAERHHDQRRQHRPHRRAETAAELKHRLRKSVAPAGGEPRDPRRLRMKHRRAEADQRGRDQDDAVVMRDAEQQQAEEGKAHADRERERLRLLVGEMPDHRLQQRRGELERQRDHADLGEVQRVSVLQDRIDRGDQRLHGVVEEVREADAGQHDIGRPRDSRLGGEARRHVRHDHRRGQRFFGDDDGLVQGRIPEKNRGQAMSRVLRRRPSSRPASIAYGCDALSQHRSSILRCWR